MRLLWLVLCCAAVVHAARLLAVLPTNTKSHYAMYGRLLQALAARQHNITIISHFPMLSLLSLSLTNTFFKRNISVLKPGIRYYYAKTWSTGFTCYLVSVKSPPPNVEQISLAGTIPEITNNLTRQPHNSIKPDFIRNLEQIMKECVHACETVSQIPAVKALVNSNTTFDMVIVEVFGSDCFLPLGRRFKAPVVGFLSSVPLPWVNEQLGNPEATAYVPSYMMGYGQHMTMWERFANTIAVILAKIIYIHKSQIPSQVIADRLFGTGPKLDTLANEYSLVLSNSHFSINEVRPLVPALVEVGGLHLDDSQTLSKDMKKLLDESTDGVVYWSFGSMSKIETIPNDKLSQIFQVLSELPQTVFVKMDRRMLARNLTVPDNIYTMDWIPQYATLCHPNVKLFISHGGLLGTQEAVACGVPMLMVPLYADQALNARAMTDRGIAQIVKLKEFDKDSWRNTIHELLGNQKYKDNALKLRDVFLDRPMRPLDTGVYWIEYILRHKGAPHLRSPALDLSLPQYLLLDLVALSIAVTVMTIFILHILYRYLCTRCIKWWPKEKLLFEKRLFKRNISFFVCLLWKYKMKTN